MAHDYERVEYQKFLASTFNSLASVYRLADRAAEAEVAYHKALKIYDRLARKSANAIEFTSFLGAAQINWRSRPIWPTIRTTRCPLSAASLANRSTFLLRIVAKAPVQPLSPRTTKGRSVARPALAEPTVSPGSNPL